MAANNKEEIVTIKFRKNHSPYIAHDVAGFKESIASRLVERGYADYYKDRQLETDNTKDKDNKNTNETKKNKPALKKKPLNRSVE